MQKWVYGTLELEEEREIEWGDRLKEWGDRGWEMVAVVAHHTRNTYVVFFRERVE